MYTAKPHGTCTAMGASAVADEDKPTENPAPEAAKVIDGDNVPNDAGTQKAAEQETK